MAILGKKAKKIKRKAKKKIHEATRSPDYAMAPIRSEDLPAPATGGGMREPTYPPSALAVQRAGKDARKRKSMIKKKTIKAMHREINRRVAAVGEEGVMIGNPDVPDHEKYVALGRMVGNVGDTLANGGTDGGPNPAPELVRNELIRVMAVTGLWAQSLAGKRRER